VRWQAKFGELGTLAGPTGSARLTSSIDVKLLTCNLIGCAGAIATRDCCALVRPHTRWHRSECSVSTWPWPTQVLPAARIYGKPLREGRRFQAGSWHGFRAALDTGRAILQGLQRMIHANRGCAIRWVVVTAWTHKPPRGVACRGQPHPVCMRQLAGYLVAIGSVAGACATKIRAQRRRRAGRRIMSRDGSSSAACR